jgi:hypothetical protein
MIKQCFNDCRSQTRRNADAYATNHTTHQNIPNHVFVPIPLARLASDDDEIIGLIPGAKVHSNDDGSDYQDTDVGQETWRDKQLLEIQNLTNGLLFRTYA